MFRASRQRECEFGKVTGRQRTAAVCVCRESWGRNCRRIPLTWMQGLHDPLLVRGFSKWGSLRHPALSASRSWDPGIPSAASHVAKLPLIQCLCMAGASYHPFIARNDSIQSCYNSTLSYAGKQFVGLNSYWGNCFSSQI